MQSFFKLLLMSSILAPGIVVGKTRPPAKLSRAKKSNTVRLPASNTSQPALKVFDEKTSFEHLLEKRELYHRQPSAFDVKARVIGIRRDIGLSNSSDDSSQRDVVLNAGSNAGISPGMILSVKRKIPILDPYRDNVQRQLDIVFAKIKVVHVQDELAIARIDSVDDISKGPAIGLRSVVIGDYVGAN